MITKAGQTVRCAVQNIRETSRGSKGVKLVNLSPKDFLVGLSEVVELDEEIDDSDGDAVKDDSAETVPDVVEDVSGSSENVLD
jgi:DNA gyrase subunit A